MPLIEKKAIRLLPQKHKTKKKQDQPNYWATRRYVYLIIKSEAFFP